MAQLIKMRSNPRADMKNYRQEIVETLQYGPASLNALTADHLHAARKLLQEGVIEEAGMSRTGRMLYQLHHGAHAAAPAEHSPNVSSDLKRRYEFFRSQGYGSQTAISLARAEKAAEERGWECEWEHDEDPDLSWADEQQLAEIREVLTCVLKDEDGQVLDALGGISDPSREYSRVVEAEMALNALMEHEGYAANREPACEMAAEELVLFIDNERDLAPFGPEGQGKAAADNLRRKMARGTYDPLLAPKQMMYVADAGAKRYTKEHGTPGPHGSFGIFNKATRELAAQMLARAFEEELEAEGEYQPNQGDSFYGDGYYVAQWIIGDRVLYEQSYDDEDAAISAALNEMNDPTFEGDQARVITVDGELVWDSEG